MPKNRMKRKTRSGAIIHSRPCIKFRIGPRKDGTAATLMSNDDLKNVLNDKDKKRYHPNAISVLRLRGIKVNWPGNLDQVATLEDLAQDMQLA